MLWVTVFGVIIIPLIGWVFNTLITKKIDALEQKQKEDKELFFRKYDALVESLEKYYVLKAIYEQAMQFLTEKNDEKFKSMLSIVTTQFENVEEKIEGLKTLINEKFSHGKGAI